MRPGRSADGQKKESGAPALPYSKPCRQAGRGRDRRVTAWRIVLAFLLLAIGGEAWSQTRPLNRSRAKAEALVAFLGEPAGRLFSKTFLTRTRPHR